jgi:hypothetical protein
VSCSETVDLSMKQGAGFSQVFRWGQPAFTWKAVTAVPSVLPVRLTAAAHGIPDGWPFAVLGTVGMTQLNRDDPPYFATVIDANTVEINDLDGSSFSAYVSGGAIRFSTPVDLTGYTARIQIRASLNSDVLLTLTQASGITINNTTKTITVVLTAAQIEALGVTQAVYSLQLTSAGGVPTQLVAGDIFIEQEATHD